MARIIVTPDERSDVVLLEERIYPVHLDNRVSSLQMIERLAWAVNDAEASEQLDAEEHEDSERQHGRPREDEGTQRRVAKDRVHA